MKALFFDCQAGIAGDMTVAALLDLGVPLAHLETELGKLPLPADSYTLSTRQVKRHGFSALEFVVAAREEHHHRHYAEIAAMISDSGLSGRAKELASKIFSVLAAAEAKVHGVPLDEVHFHEVGAIDSIVDIVGVAICLDYLGIDRFTNSSLPLCSGFIDSAHGRLPLPAPATAELLQGLPIHGNIGAGERVTPTGAAIVAALGEGDGLQPGMRIEKIGHGAGGKDFPDCPNILRAFLGSVAAETEGEQLLVIEANIDDSTPEVLAHAQERLLAAGAPDVWFTPIVMKKGRPAVTMSLLSHPKDVDHLTRIVFAESSAIGVRSYPVSRTILERRIEERQTPLGMVRFKVTPYGEKPEYEDCRRIALERGVALREVLRILGKG